MYFVSVISMFIKEGRGRGEQASAHKSHLSKRKCQRKPSGTEVRLLTNLVPHHQANSTYKKGEEG